ncbi:16S rRNA (uracil(1498)-N(3))-methyltransferase [Anaerotignum faecicola]|nr:16S rRNA (uracil(1498)-N(3))-methyltransferase [Anaerotignum faecicola]
MPRYFIKPEDMHGETVFIRDEDAKHLGGVLRAKEGDIVEACDGRGMDYSCVIKEVGKTEILMEIESARPTESEPKTKITLFQGLPKADKMELIIQKCVEIGVWRIVPVAAERSVVRLEGKDAGKKLERWRKISLSAAKQSGRGIIPEIGEIVSFKEAVKMAACFDGAAIPYEKEEKNGIKEYANSFDGSSLGLFIGPEGGFDDREIEFAVKNNISPVTLGKRILRTETAAMVSAAILLYELG